MIVRIGVILSVQWLQVILCVYINIFLDTLYVVNCLFIICIDTEMSMKYMY